MVDQRPIHIKFYASSQQAQKPGTNCDLGKHEDEGQYNSHAIPSDRACRMHGRMVFHVSYFLDRFTQLGYL